jgi:AraC-like DNA-binding protein
MIYHTETYVMFLINQLINAGVSHEHCHKAIGFSLRPRCVSLTRKIYNDSLMNLYHMLNDIGYQKHQELKEVDSLFDSDNFHGAYLSNSINFSDFIQRAQLVCNSNSSVNRFSLITKNNRLFIYLHNQMPSVSCYSPQSFYYLLAKYAESVFKLDKASLDAEVAVCQKDIPDESKIESYVADKINLNQDCAFISFPMELIDLPNSSYNSNAASFINNYFYKIYGISSEADRSFENNVSMHISNILHLHTADLTIEVVAKRMNMSRSTLYRNLVDRGVTFSELVDISRQNYALDYLKKSNMSLQEISDRLGYANLSAFSRAFKRWYDISPSFIRKSQEYSSSVLIK